VAQAATLSPGADYEPPTTSWVAIAAAVVLLALLRRSTGIRFRRAGARAVLLVAAALLGCLALFSISLGLVAQGLAWGVAITALAAFGLVTWLSTLAFRAAVREIARRG
jgi:CHASE2 domain-containing sensor protein